MRIGLVVSLDAMLGYIRRLAQVAEVERRHHRVAFDVHEGVPETQVAFVLGLSELRFSPVGVPLCGIARGCGHSRRKEYIDVVAGLGVLGKVTEKINLPALQSGIKVQARNGVDDSEL